MSNQSSKVTICLIMTCLLVLMPHSGFLANHDHSKEEIEIKSINSYSSNSQTVWEDGEQPWPQSGKTPDRQSTPPSHSPDGGAGIESPGNNSELLSIVNPVINWQYSNYAFSTDALATPVADLSESIISDEESLERCGGDSLFIIIIQTEDVGGAPHSFLKIIEGEDADLAWEVDLGEITDSGRDEIKASPVVVDLDFDGKQEIIVSYDLSGTFYVKAFSPELTLSLIHI